MLIRSCSVLYHKPSVLIPWGQCIPRMDRKHLLTKGCNLLEVAFVTLHVIDPYKMTDFTLVLNIRSFVCLDIVLDFHTGLRVMKADLALLIPSWMSRSDPLSLLMLLPMQAKSSSSSISSSLNYSLSAFIVLILIPFVFDLLILRPAFARIIRVILECMSWHLIIQSMTNKSRKGDNKHPWRTPVSISISSERIPLWMILQLQLS